MMGPADKSIQNELEILKHANHPFLIKYIEEFECKDFNKLCIVTKFVNGGNLNKLMKKVQIYEEDAL